MVFSHDTTINPITIILKSNEGILNNSSKKSSISFELNNNIIIPSNIDAYVHLSSLKFLNAFYNINSTNNMFYYSVSSLGIGIVDIYSFEIPIGNYNITTLLELLNAELIGYITIEYIESTFKLSFSSVNNTFILRTGINNILKVLGFTNEDTNEINLIVSVNLINLSGIQMLYICIDNFNISNVLSKNSALHNVINEININTLTGTTQTYENNSTVKYKIINSLINRIDLNIYDENDLLVDFNNTDFYLSLNIIFSYKNNYIPGKTLNLNNPNDNNNITDENIIEDTKK